VLVLEFVECWFPPVMRDREPLTIYYDTEFSILSDKVPLIPIGLAIATTVKYRF